MKLSALELELYEELDKNIYKGVFANFIAAFLLFLLLWPQFPPYFFAWFVSLSIVMMIRALVTYLYNKQKIQKFRAVLFSFIGIVLSALIWVAAVWLFFPHISLQQRTFMAMILMAMSAGFASSFASIKVFGITYISITLFGLALQLFLDGTKEEMLLGVGVMVLYGYLYNVVETTSKMYRNLITLSHQKEILLEQYEKNNTELKLIFENTPIGIFFYDKDLRIIDANSNLANLLGIAHKKFRNFDLTTLQAPEILYILRSTLETGMPYKFEGEYTIAGLKKKLAIRLMTNPVKDREGVVIGGLAMIEDIAKELATKRQLENFAQFYLENPNPVFQVDCEKGAITIQNSAAKHLLGQLNKKSLLHKICMSASTTLEEHIGVKVFSFDVVPIDEKRKNVYGKDVTEQKRAQQEAEFFAYYDELTKLPRKKLFLEFIKKAQKLAKRYGTYNALLFIDLDNFKRLNDMYGHTFGDMFLVAVANRFLEILRGEDVITRLGGDEFAVLLQNLSTDKEEAKQKAQKVAKKILATLKKPIVIEGIQVHSSASIGIVLFQDEDAETLFVNADMAMYEAKRQGKESYYFFDERIKQENVYKNSLALALEDAIEKGDFIVYFQPIVGLFTSTISAEALIRWMYKGKLISPALFIPLAEERKVISHLSRIVLRKASAFAIHEHRIERVAVNLSTIDLHNPQFFEWLQEDIDNRIIDPVKIELEITETLALEDYVTVKERIQELKSLGFRIAIDDFGTGYSSMYYIKHLAIDTIKIDKTFVDQLEHDKKEFALTSSIIHMAHLLGLKTVAEGVERKEQLALLRQLQCDKVQGFFIAPPMSKEEFRSYLDSKLSTIFTLLQR